MVDAGVPAVQSLLAIHSLTAPLGIESKEVFMRLLTRLLVQADVVKSTGTNRSMTPLFAIDANT
jgi:hypothetical protein